MSTDVLLDLTDPPAGFIDDPYPFYSSLLQQAPVHPQADGSLLVSRHADLTRIYRDTATFSSDKTKVFYPKYGNSLLYEHHTTSLVFNDPPLHTRVRKIIAGAMTPSAINPMRDGIQEIVTGLLDKLPTQAEQSGNEGQVDLISGFAAQIPVNVIGNLFDIPVSERDPLRDWSLAILGALEPAIDDQQQRAGIQAVADFKHYLSDLTRRRRKRPGNPETDVLTRLMFSEKGDLSETELFHNCIFILNAGHETTTNLIGNALALLDQHAVDRQQLLSSPDGMAQLVEETLRMESPNQLGNRLVTADTRIGEFEVAAGTNLHLLIGAANRDPSQFSSPEQLSLQRKPNKHLAFAGGPHACIGLNLARMEGVVALTEFLKRFPGYAIAQGTRSQRLRFRGYHALLATLAN